MGASKSKTSEFFIKNLDSADKFKYTLSNGETILFSLQGTPTEEYFDIHGEILDKPIGSSRVTIRCDSNCDQKSDKASYTPDVKFRVFYDKERFWESNFKDKTIKPLMLDLEFEIIG